MFFRRAAGWVKRMKSPLLNYPGIAIRLAHERRQRNDENTLIMCRLKRVDVLPEINAFTRHHSSSGRSIALVQHHEANNVFKKQLHLVLILGCTGTVNRAVHRN